MNVSLTPELENFIGDKVKSGLYQTASEVIRDSLRLLKSQEEYHILERQELRNKIAVGLNQLKNGKGITGENVFDEIRAMSDGRRPNR